MVDRNAIKPGAPRGLASELVHFAEGLQKDIVGGIFGLLRIAKEPQG